MRLRYGARLLLALVAILAMVAPAGASPRGAGEGLQIYLAGATFDPVAAPPAKTPRSGALELAGQGDFYLLQFDGPVMDGWKAAVEAAGARLVQYVPDYAFVVKLETATPDALTDLPHVRWVGPYVKGYKVPAGLEQRAQGLQAQEPMEVLAHLFAGESSAEARAAVADADGAVLEVAESELLGDVLHARIPADALATLADLPAVAWIEAYHPVELHNDRARNIMGVHSAWSSMAGAGVNLYGAGQIVDVVDSGLDTGNPATLSADFQGRLLKAYAHGRTGDWSDNGPNPPAGHGTHVAGSIVGTGLSSGSNPAAHNYASSFAGVAPEARIVFQSVMRATGSGLAVPTDLKTLFAPAHNDGARIHSNSWGGPTGGADPNLEYGGYTTLSQSADEFAWLYPTSLLVFSAGNYGIDANANGIVDGDSISMPGTAKNVLTVGATENNRPPATGQGGYSNLRWGAGWPTRYAANPIKDDFVSNNTGGLAAFSGHGPTDDSRIKPEIVAPGTDIISARAHTAGAGTGWGIYDANYVYNGGTSMSTPLVAGAAALVRQYYTDVKGWANPTAALLKATLINGATDIAPGQYGAAGTQEIPSLCPSNAAGFGRANLPNALALGAGEGLAYWDIAGGLGTGQSNTQTVSLAGGAGRKFNATLVWTDFPGSAGAGKALVNDLDLEVIAPNGTRYYGNGRVFPDHQNNSERVTIEAPAAGQYQVRVKGFNVPQGPQPYALVVTGAGVSQAQPTPRIWMPPATPTPTRTATRPPATSTATPTATQPPATPSPTPTTGTPGVSTRTLLAAADATVAEGEPSTNFGTQQDVLLGYDEDEYPPDDRVVRGLMRFDLSSVPAGSEIRSAALRLYYEGYWDYEETGVLDRITAYQALGNWSELGVAWSNQPGAGAAYGSVDLPAYESEFGWYEIDLTDLVQAWANGTPNYGIVLRGEEAAGADSSWRLITSREGTTTPPTLVVQYVPPAGAPDDASVEPLEINPGGSMVGHSGPAETPEPGGKRVIREGQ